MKNIEKIRRMNKSELAVLLRCPYGLNQGFGDECKDIDQGCLVCCMQWLDEEEDV